MRFIVDVAAFDRTETVEVEASDVAEALRRACEKVNISVRFARSTILSGRLSKASSRSREAEARPWG